MPAPNTGSITETQEGFNRTGTHVSTNIIIEVGGNAVGAVKSLNVTESRSIATIDEVGTDGHIDSVPSKSTDVTGSCNRTRFDNLRIAAAFGRSYVHVAAQRIPFDIRIIDTFAGPDPASQLVTVIDNVWISKISYSYKADDFVIVEDMDWTAERIYTILGANSNAVPGAAGGRNLPITQLDPFERQADRGDRRGALDGAGLLLAIEEA